MLEVTGITKDFVPAISLDRLVRFDLGRGRPLRALDGVSFSLPKGQALAVLGPNGAGKTTLLRIIAGLILPDTGSVAIDGLRPGRDDKKIKSAIGFASFQERSFYWRLTGRQNLDFFASLYGLEGAAAAKKIGELLSLFGISDAGVRFDSCSSGMKQKIALIRSLVHDPAVLLLDEPMRSLDHSSRAHLKDTLRGLVSAKKTVVFTTHHIDEAAEIADLYLVLAGGRAVAFGTAADLKRLAASPADSLADVYMRLTERPRA